MKEKGSILFQLFLPILGGSIIGILIRNFMDYNNLIQPHFAPPAILFPIAWSILYLLIGFGYFLYRKLNNNKVVILLYYIHLVVNFFWSIIFFIFKWRLFSVLWIIFLVILVMMLMYYFYSQRKISFYLFIPYLLWLFFATYLTIGIYLLN